MRIFSTKMLLYGWLTLAGIALLCPAVAAQNDVHSHEMSGSDMQTMNGHSLNFTGLIQQHRDSGTDVSPASVPGQMLMTEKSGWMFMLHGEAFVNELQQSGPRGADKLFSTNWIMPMAQRKLGLGTLTLRTMFSLEPATVSDRRYPELFQQGETAFGKPVVDGQHPHDLFMELAAFYDVKINDTAMISFYGGPRGDPALGPVAYPHRAAASENPVAPLGHHLEDSTHIANDVVTGGVTYRNLRFEVSGFHGREPDENRWNLDGGVIDSWSFRITANPGQNWSLQYSVADLHSPEMIAPEEDVRRMTASIIYNKPLSAGNWSTMLLWGRNQSLEHQDVGNGYLLESTLKFAHKNYAWTRIENVDRTNELLFANGDPPAGFSERYLARVQAYTGGYDRELVTTRYLSLALGGQITFYGVPDVFRPVYDAHPVGGLVFLRIRTQ